LLQDDGELVFSPHHEVSDIFTNFFIAMSKGGSGTFISLVVEQGNYRVKDFLSSGTKPNHWFLFSKISILSF
jgi:hypothetical protein